MPLAVGQKAPDFSCLADDGTTYSLKDFAGRRFILYFYPKDDTSGCTKEACSFTENLSAFNKLGVTVLGASKDNIASHKKFKEKYGLTFPLLSDEDGKLCEAYETWVEKSMYGKKYMGIDRSTFLIDTDGSIKALWRKVKVDGHIEEILETIKGE